jgi:hypothetical protein
LHDSYYACGYEGEEIVLQPAYLTEAEVLALADEGYALCACTQLPIAEKRAVQVTAPETGLRLAVEAKSAKSAFAELEAVYVRKSSAELNLCR